MRRSSDTTRTSSPGFRSAMSVLIRTTEGLLPSAIDALRHDAPSGQPLQALFLSHLTAQRPSRYPSTIPRVSAIEHYLPVIPSNAF